MRRIQESKQFIRDLRLQLRRGKNIELIDEIVKALHLETPLPERAQAHALKGDWNGYWECHVTADWLLVWRIEGDVVRLVRTGTHADIFNK